MKIPFKPIENIEVEALGLLADYGRKYKPVLVPPVPVEAILEAHLGFGLEFDDLAQRLGIADALGAAWVQARRVVVDQALDPTSFPAKEGRFRFTIAHEVGHWELHRQFFMENPAQGGLFGDGKKPSIVCRTGSRKDPMEWQADCFAGFLLMPKDMVFQGWEKLRGGRQAYIAVNEIKDLKAKWGLADDNQPSVDLARTLAGDFKVSGQAMQIRLIGLGLIKTEQPEPDLFN
jgi:hypothetical protein